MAVDFFQNFLKHFTVFLQRSYLFFIIMEELIEQVISLCPDCDRDEVERDLNLTGDIEMTINHALDGMV